MFPPQTHPHAETVSAGHGRIDRRRLYASTRLNTYVDWPGVGQVVCLDRTRLAKATGALLTHQRHFYITSLSAQRATPQALLHLCRSHGTIENRSHYVRDVTFHEDRSPARQGNLPQVMAAFRNLVLTALRRLGVVHIPSALIQNAACPFFVFGYLCQ